MEKKIKHIIIVVVAVIAIVGIGIGAYTWYNAQLGEEVTFTSEATLYKMLASGGSVYDKLWMYYTGSAGWGERLNVYLYSGNEFVKILDTYRRNDNSP